MNSSMEQPVQTLLQSINDNRLPLGVTTAFVLGVVLIVQSSVQKTILSDIPSVGKGRESSRRKEFMSTGGAKRLYAEGYHKVCSHL